AGRAERRRLEALERLGADKALARIAEVAAVRIGIAGLASRLSGKRAGSGTVRPAEVLERTQDLIALLGAGLRLRKVLAAVVDVVDQLVEALALLIGEIAVLRLDRERL